MHYQHDLRRIRHEHRRESVFSPPHFGGQSADVDFTDMVSAPLFGPPAACAPLDPPVPFTAEPDIIVH